MKKKKTTTQTLPTGTHSLASTTPIAIEWTQLIWMQRHQNSLCYLPVVGGASSWPLGLVSLDLVSLGGPPSSSSESLRGCDPFPLDLAAAVELFAVLDGMIRNLKGIIGFKKIKKIFPCLFLCLSLWSIDCTSTLTMWLRWSGNYEMTKCKIKMIRFEWEYFSNCHFNASWLIMTYVGVFLR